MKHSLKVTSIILLFFLLTQIIGLSLISLSANQTKTIINGQETIKVNYTETALGERPQFETEYGSLIYLLVGVFFGTLLILVLMKIKLGGKLWKYWYLIAIIFSMTVALGVLMNNMLALIISIILGIWKIRSKGNFWIHNLTEILLYAGLGVVLAPMFDVLWASILLIIISLYDMYAVWESKHMIKLAKFTMKNKLFAGIMIQYEQKNNKTKIITTKNKITNLKNIGKPKHHPATKKQAILGGGDIVFPLIFTGAVFTSLLTRGFNLTNAFSASLIITVTTAISLYLLFYLGKKNKFYPAMPFISAGCFIGLGLIELIFFLF